MELENDGLRSCDEELVELSLCDVTPESDGDCERDRVEDAISLVNEIVVDGLTASVPERLGVSMLGDGVSERDSILVNEYDGELLPVGLRVSFDLVYDSVSLSTIVSVFECDVVGCQVVVLDDESLDLVVVCVRGSEGVTT